MSYGNKFLSPEFSFTDLEEVEEAIEYIRKLESKMEWLKSVKSYRERKIKENLSSIESDIDKIKTLIRDNMINKKEKTIEFPGTAKVTVKSNPSAYEYDEKNIEKLFKVLRDAGIYSKIVSEETLFKVDKTELKKFLKQLDTNRNLPEFINKKDKDPSLSISFDEGFVPGDNFEESNMESFDKI